MVKMVGNFKGGELINKLINDKIDLIKENKRLARTIEEMEQQYKNFYSSEENIEDALQSTYGQASVEDYENWTGSEDYDKLAQAYSEFKRDSIDYSGFDTYKERENEYSNLL